jgi:hypothetical protein
MIRADVLQLFLAADLLLHLQMYHQVILVLSHLLNQVKNHQDSLAVLQQNALLAIRVDNHLDNHLVNLVASLRANLAASQVVSQAASLLVSPQRSLQGSQAKTHPGNQVACLRQALLRYQ